MSVAVVRTVADLRTLVAGWRAAGERIALVPTMGALHAGHARLTRAARDMAAADRVVASIFVNPTQFGEGEDFDAYPRQEADDLAVLDAHGVDAAYIPGAAAMYPQGFQTRVFVPGLAKHLCGAARPGHFDGVAQVVSKLFNQALPDVALFGEKDFQQLAIIRRMAIDLDFQVQVMGVPTVREEDGLAMSSRNAYLTAQERAIAPTLYATLTALAQAIRAVGFAPAMLEDASKALLAAGFAKVDYVAAVDPDTLDPLPDGAKEGRLLAAAKLGRARLIDNISI